MKTALERRKSEAFSHDRTQTFQKGRVCFQNRGNPLNQNPNKTAVEKQHFIVMTTTSKMEVDSPKEGAGDGSIIETSKLTTTLPQTMIAVHPVRCSISCFLDVLYHVSRRDLVH
jgi:hypothetical protein